MSNHTFRSSLTLAIALAFVALVIFGFVTYANIVAVRQSEAFVAHSYAVRETTRELLSSVMDLESKERGYLITADPSFLEPYEAACKDVDDHFARLRKLTKNQPAQQNRVEQLQQLVEQQQKELAATIKLRNTLPETAGFERARQMMMAEHGKRHMDRVRQMVANILDEAGRPLAERTEAARWRATESERFIIVGNLIALAVLLLSAAAAHIDRQKRGVAEANLRFSQAELNAIFDSAAEGIIAFNEDLSIRLMNPSAANIYRCEAAAALGHSLLEFFPAGSCDFVANDVRTFLASSETVRPFADVTALRLDGSEFPCDGSLTKSSAEYQQFVTLMFRDLSESRARDAKIRQQAEMLDQVRDAIAVCDMDDRIISWNRGAQSLYGYAAEQVLGQNAIQLVFGNCREAWEVGREAMLKCGAHLAEISHVDPQGREHILEHRRSLIRDSDGRPVGQLLIHLDITARKQEEARQRRSQCMDSIGTLAGGVAHDLNNVLTPILMSAKLLKHGSTNQERLLDVIATSAERGGQMLNRLLAFAGGEQGQRERIDVAEILSEAENILRHTLPKSIDVQVACAKSLHRVSGNSTELLQVVMNLAINVRDAMPDGGTLELRAENLDVDASQAANSDRLHAGPHALICVSDSGSGIHPEIVDRIFDPFFTTKPQGKGTGLGLATSLGIIRSHDGDITVDSELGRGSAFSIYLPEATAAQGPSIPSGTDDVSSGHHEMILLADDEPLIVETARATLEASGYRVATAGDGAQAVAYYRENFQSVDVVLLDVMMPGMDGFDTRDALRAVHPHVRIIASSGLRRPNEHRAERLADVDGFLSKPYSDEQLLRVVRNVLDVERSEIRAQNHRESTPPTGVC